MRKMLCVEKIDAKRRIGKDGQGKGRGGERKPGGLLSTQYFYGQKDMVRVQARTTVESCENLFST